MGPERERNRRRRPIGRRLLELYLSADPRALALGRIALALTLLLDLARRARSLDVFYANDGLLPNHTVLWRPPFEWTFSLFFAASRGYEAALGFALCAVAYGMLLLGVRTRAAQIASLVAVISLHGRNLFLQNGGDVALVELCLWTAFLPTGLRYSVDALALDADRGARSPVAWFEARGRRARVVHLAVLALTLQLAAVYAFNALQKTGATWRDGTVVHYMLHQDGIVTPVGVWVRGWLTLAQSQWLTWSVRATEAMLPVLLLAPFRQRLFRGVAVGAIVLLHGGFELMLSLGIFAPAMIAFTPNLLARNDLDAFERFVARARVRLAAVFDGPRGRAALGFVLARAAAPRRSWRFRWVGELTVAALLVVEGLQLLVDNPDVSGFPRAHQPRLLSAIAVYLQGLQSWSMYAPEAPTTDLNVYVDAVTVDGRHVDPFNEVASPGFPNPGPRIPPHLGQSALFYAYALRIPWNADYHPAFSAWILQYPERTGNPRDRLRSFEVFYVEDDSPPPGEKAPRNTRTRLLFKYPG